MSDKVKTERIGMKRIQLLEKAKTLPSIPGCYLLKKVSSDGEVEDILYVGKAKNLKSRVSSYFNNSPKSPKTDILVSHVNNFDFIITDNESEAFVLENNLIKKHYPKYNIRLKDDKSYPYVSIDLNEPFARPVYTRKPNRAKKIKLFGPFTTGSNISQVIRILMKSFMLRDCSLAEFNRRKRPCLLFEINQCSAPCVGKINEQDYLKDLNFVINFFEGKSKKALKELEDRMMNAASEEKFELAASIRDNLQVLKEFCEGSFEQNVEMNNNKNLDVISYYVGDIELDISCYMVRNGIVLGHKNFHFQKGDDALENEEIFMNFLYQYYTTTRELTPDEIVVDLADNNIQILKDSLLSALDTEIKISSPGKQFANIFSLTSEHAKEHQRFRNKNEDSPWVGLNKLRELLNLKETPKLLECYDVAIWQGSSPTASQIVFDEGVPDKKRYRYYALEEREEGNNDFEMMKEVLSRRLKKGKLPDVFIVDGGKGQVNSFLEVLKDFDLNIPVVGIAKERSGKHQSFKDTAVAKSEERLIIPNRLNPYILKKCPSLMRIVVSMRDEAHRFSRKLHHKKEKDRIFNSWFNDIEGIGPKTREKIQTNLDVSIEELKSFSTDQIMDKFLVSEVIAKKIKKKLSSDSF
ncbi:excinuclease ABC subunit UvrC [Bacteriovorax sp. Seq25_V]|uniref:excinuclease ABC subunit UvrC n=1 Tax=Bacteriovorax sp. Seq25_V TaxID=1201288 RepID=UPI00038A49D8|nr:excinuclease ABC subunit UvrC [Bacteriovorax sp. Seq25_V]EQC47234.1 excinuclease ABC, C subunit [Bacteriovorax sp. Seq25_V]